MASIKEMDQYAKQWVKEAGERIRESFETTLNIETKTNRNDLVTNIDKDTERYFVDQIKKVFPEHRIFGEEGMGNDIQDLKGIVWIIDPIDGTLNFIHQQRNFAISLAIYEDGIGKIGMIYDVVHDELYHAVKGEGAYLNETKLSPLSEGSIDKAIVSLNARWIVKNKRINPEILATLVKDVRGTRSYGSAALEMAYIAAGRLDAYITMRLAPWDYAAGAILIEETGGRVTDLFGNELDYINGGSFFGAKSGLHKSVLENYILAHK
jgi:myo-inositol-1(or 4)-monophosphatase